MKLFYTQPSNPYFIQKADCLDQLVVELYSGQAQFLTEEQIQTQGLEPNYNDLLRNKLSQYEERVPLYDINFNHIYLVYKENVYPRIYQDNYRFVDNNFYQDLLLISDPSEVDLDNLRILNHYNLDLLMQTYWKIFYQSYVLNSYITSCRRPSFQSGMEHIQPYYSINELYYLAYDWNLTQSRDLSEEQIQSLCSEIAAHDISAKTLLDHQIYIYNQRAIGLVKYYSLYGSYFINVYLRRTGCCVKPDQDCADHIRNPNLESQINVMIKLIKNAPIFEKDHTVYRFLQNDRFLKDVQVGGIYQDCSFMSTTRNPFYYKENYAFGYILLKIKLPANVKGIGLCIESYSNFPREEEIVLLPTSRFRIDSITEIGQTEYHEAFDLEVTKKYELTWLSNDYIKEPAVNYRIQMLNAYSPPIQLVDLRDFLSNPNITQLSVANRINYFKDNYVNMNNQFESQIGETTYLFNIEAYDSSTVYAPFFYYEVTNGIMITSNNPKFGNINLMIEIGSDIHVNYYFKYSVNDSSEQVNLNRAEWIEWLSLLTYVFGSRQVILHSNYVLKYDLNATARQKQLQTRYTYSENIYEYMKNGFKYYQFIEVTPNFDYVNLDYLFGVEPDEVIKPNDLTELPNILSKSNIDNLGNFYLYIVENYPKLLETLIEAIGRLEIFDNPELNPFNNISYTLSSYTYLYNQDLLSYIPVIETVTKGSFSKLVGNKKIPKFKNRLRSFLATPIKDATKNITGPPNAR